MKIYTEEKKSHGLEALGGQVVQIWCLNYIYTGTLLGVNEHDIILEDPKVVYETGKLMDKGWKDAQSLGVKEWRIRTQAIESYGLVNV